MFREMFQAQLNTMVMWFDQWNESGQTVALFKMLTRLAPTQARFVSIALEHSLNECAELAMREKEANNPGFVSGLLCESKEVAMTQTLVHLPLLRPGNAEARACYLALIPSLLTHAVETELNLEDARQLLSYVLIHPALRTERKNFEPWRKSLGEKLMNTPKVPNTGDAQQKTRRSNSLTPPFAVTPSAEWSSAQEDAGKVRRYSLSSEQFVGPPLSPQSSQASSGSGSETQLDTTGYDNPAMRDVKSWLKWLRLHKYWRLFAGLTYDQMLSITDDNFESIVDTSSAPVTQGARRKIILSIAKLRERSNLLALLEQLPDAAAMQEASSTGPVKEVMATGSLLTALDEMRNILSTPIKAYVQEESVIYDDIPSQFTRVLGKICTQLNFGNNLEEEVLTTFISLLDASAHHEAFNHLQKRSIISWRYRTNHLLRRLRGEIGSDEEEELPPEHEAEDDHFQLSALHHLHQKPHHHHLQHLHHQQAQLHLQPQLQHQAHLQLQPHLQPQLQLQPHLQPQQQPHLQPQPLPVPLPHLQPHHHKQAETRGAEEESEPEINSRLESLCLRMTEQALGGSGDN